MVRSGHQLEHSTHKTSYAASVMRLLKLAADSPEGNMMWNVPASAAGAPLVTGAAIGNTTSPNRRTADDGEWIAAGRMHALLRAAGALAGLATGGGVAAARRADAACSSMQGVLMTVSRKAVVSCKLCMEAASLTACGVQQLEMSVYRPVSIHLDRRPVSRWSSARRDSSPGCCLLPDLHDQLRAWTLVSRPSTHLLEFGSQAAAPHPPSPQMTPRCRRTQCWHRHCPF